MPAEAVPDEEQRASERPAEVLDKGKDIVAGNVGRRDGKLQPHALTHRRAGDGAGHREAVVTVPTIMDGGFALGCPRPTDRGLEHAATLIKKDNSPALTPGFFEPGLDVRRPAGHGLLIALARTARRLLWAPLAAPEQTPHA